MLAEDADLAPFGIVPSERAYGAVREADACALCGAPELGRTASECATREWVERYDSASVALIEETDVEEPFRGRSGSVHPKSWEEMRSRAATDSKLVPAYPWQLDSTDAIVAAVGNTELERVAFEECLFPVCGRCFADDEHVPASIVRRAYVDLKFEGNAAAARDQRQWPLVERFLDVLSTIALPRSA